jgi:serine/threonine protein kinase
LHKSFHTDPVGCIADMKITTPKSAFVDIKTNNSHELAKIVQIQHQKLYCNEVSILQQLQGCSHIIQVSRLGTTKSIAMITYSAQIKSSLAFLVRLQPLTEATIKHYFYQVCLAVRDCHSRGIYHLDFSPETIFITSTGDIVLGSFESAKTGQPSRKNICSDYYKMAGLLWWLTSTSRTLTSFTPICRSSCMNSQVTSLIQNLMDCKTSNRACTVSGLLAHEWFKH